MIELPGCLKATPARARRVRRELAKVEAEEEASKPPLKLRVRTRKRRGHKAILARMGFTAEEIKAMTPNEANQIVMTGRRLT